MAGEATINGQPASPPVVVGALVLAHLLKACSYVALVLAGAFAGRELPLSTIALIVLPVAFVASFIGSVHYERRSKQ